jgi:hypothetical protein
MNGEVDLRYQIEKFFIFAHDSMINRKTDEEIGRERIPK